MAEKPQHPSSETHGGWAATGIVVVLYFTFMMMAGAKPELLGRPVFEGGLVSWGLVFGIGTVVLIIGLVGLYAYHRNRLDRA